MLLYPEQAILTLSFPAFILSLVSSAPPCNSWCFLNCYLRNGAQNKWVCTFPLRPEVLGLQKSSVSLNQNPRFSLPYVMETPFPGLEPWAGEPGVELGPLVPQRVYLQPIYSYLFTTMSWSVEPACSASLQFLPVSLWFPLYILNYSISVQIVFRCFLMMVVL